MIQPPPWGRAGVGGQVEKTRQKGCVSECVEQACHDLWLIEYKFSASLSTALYTSNGDSLFTQVMMM